MAAAEERPRREFLSGAATNVAFTGAKVQGRRLIPTRATGWNRVRISTPSRSEITMAIVSALSVCEAWKEADAYRGSLRTVNLASSAYVCPTRAAEARGCFASWK